MAGGTSLVWESGCFGLKVVVLPVVPVALGAVVVGSPVDVGTGEVIAGIETEWTVVSPELSLPHPAPINPMAAATGSTAR